MTALSGNQWSFGPGSQINLGVTAPPKSTVTWQVSSDDGTTWTDDQTSSNPSANPKPAVYGYDTRTQAGTWLRAVVK